MASALEGIKVLDLTGLGPASMAAMMLGDMGADVIKIDMPPGVTERGVGRGYGSPPEVGDEIQRVFANMAFNRNKKNLALNLRTEAGQRIFHKLAETSDVIIEGFRPGVMQRLGVGYESISRINPRIIFCSVSGYGQDGPYRDFPGHDPNYTAIGGVLSLVGESADTPPVLPLNISADLGAAVFQTVIGILLSLCARERTGRGQLVDISMTDGVVFLLAFIPGAAEYFGTGVVPKRGQTLTSGTEPYCAVYKTKDSKYISLCPLEPHFWRNLCRVLERDDLIPLQFAAGPQKDEVFHDLRQIFSTKTREEWFDLLTKADVPVGKVLDLDEVFSDPQVLHRQMVIEVNHPKFGKVKQMGFSIKLSDTPGKIRSLPSTLGQHTNEMLLSLGYSQEEIEKLRQEQVVY